MNNYFYANTPPQRRIDNSRVWFAAAVPVLALFIEIYANTFRLGVLVWVTAIITIIASCYADRKYLAKSGYSVDRLGFASIIIAPVYISKRATKLNESKAPAIVLVITVIYALFFNGFTAAATMSEDDMISQVRDNYVQNIAQLDGYDGYNMIETQLKNIADDDIEWRAEKSGKTVTVTAESKSFSMTFTIPFDGYAFGDISVSKCVIDGKEYKDDKLKDKLKEIFIDNSEKTVTSESTPDSSSDDSYVKA